MAALPAETRRAIIADLKAGKSHNSIAKARGVSQPTVSHIAKAEGIPAINAAPKTAIESRRIYGLDRRLELSDKLFDLIAAWLPEAKPGDMKDMVMSYAILTDKRRLEEGEATERHEYSDSARDRIARRVDELASRRRTREAAG